VLAAARGPDNARIAADLRITVDTVRKWRGRLAAGGLGGLRDLPRSGRPRRISELTRAAVVALACQLPAAAGVPVRVEHEYVRHGALALLAALDVRTGTVFAATPPATGIAPFMDLMSQVMSRPEYKDAPRVFVIVDNGSDHRGQSANRLRDAYPNAIMIYTPVHASWLNQVEIVFSIIQKKPSPPATSPAWAPSATPCWPS
jgi:hypothetical protein